MKNENKQSNIGRRYGYIRVSSDRQNLARQIKAMKTQNLSYIFQEKMSGKDTNRPELNKMLSILEENDTVVVLSIDRLARSTIDLLKLVQTFKEKNVHFVSLKENIDTTTPQGIFVITILGAMATLERSYIRERQQQGIEIAKKLGKYKGRKKKELPGFEEIINRVKSGTLTVEEASKLLNISRSTFYRRLKEYESDNEIIDF